MSDTVVLTGINKKSTIQNVKSFLKDYNKWHLKSMEFSTWLDSSTNTSESSQLSKAEMECQLRIQTLAIMRRADQQTAFLADLLNYRFIKGWQVKKVCESLAEQYQLGYVAERTFHRYQNQALLIFALTCPRSLFIND